MLYEKKYPMNINYSSVLLIILSYILISMKTNYILLIFIIWYLFYDSQTNISKNINKSNSKDLIHYIKNKKNNSESIITNNNIRDIYVNIKFIKKFNKTAYNNSLYYCKQFLELIDNNSVFPENIIENIKDNKNSTLNELSSIVVSLPNFMNIQIDNNNISQPVEKILTRNIEKLHIEMEKMIKIFCLDNKLKLISSHINNPEANPIDTIGYSRHYSLF